MRILHLCSYPVYSGPLRPTLELALTQHALGHTVHLAWDDSRVLRYEEPAAARIPPSLRADLGVVLSAKSSVLQVWRDVRWLRRAQYDIVHCHTSHDHVLARLAGCRPLVRTVHAARALGPTLLRRKLLGTADGLILRCEDHRRRLAVDVPRRLIPGGFDCTPWATADPLARARARERLKLPADVPMVVQVAHMVGRGQRELLAAASAIQELHVLLVGDGPERTQLGQCGARGRVHFTGYLQDDLLRTAYAASDAAFLARAGNDASARAAQEAMAAGLPLICVRTDALADLKEDAVYFCGDGIELALRYWLSDPASRAGVGRRFLETERTLDQEAQATLAFYGDLIHSHLAAEMK